MEQKMKERKSYQEYQMKQALSRREKESEDRLSQMRNDVEMFAATQKKWDASIRQIQSLVPAGLEVEFPKTVPRARLVPVAKP
jgi:hypothetical protein